MSQRNPEADARVEIDRQLVAAGCDAWAGVHVRRGAVLHDPRCLISTSRDRSGGLAEMGSAARLMS
jgi:hypothetical protein